MPDMSAFDMGTVATASFQTSSLDSPPDQMRQRGSGKGTLHRGRMLAPPAPRSPFRLLCPPTPVRTPVWATAAAHVGPAGDSRDGTREAVKGGSAAEIWTWGMGHVRGFGRSDSLVTTKVLAACPPQILDGLSSLENSLLEDQDGSGVNNSSSHADHLPASLAASFSTVQEEENDGGYGNKYGDGSDDGFKGLDAEIKAKVTREDGAKTGATLRPSQRLAEGLETQMIESADVAPTNSDVKSPFGDGNSGGTPISRRGFGSNGTASDKASSVRSPSGSLFRGSGGSSKDSLSVVSPAASTVPQGSERHWHLRIPKGDGGDRASDKGADRTTDGGPGEVGSVISFETDFENLGLLGSGTFADVYKARSRSDGQTYAIKRNRRQFRGKRDRERAMAEVRTMQRLQSFCATENIDRSSKSAYCVYLLFFIRAWQEDGHFFCQTELCCRDTCRQMMSSLTSRWDVARSVYPSLERNLPPPHGIVGSGRLIPELTVWKICHDVSAGLSHIHSHGMVHYDIKPSNIFFVPHVRLGGLCKIGDFGLAGDSGTNEDGAEGDTMYMAPELLSSMVRKHPSADVFSLGLMIYEMSAADCTRIPFLPTEGLRWHELRGGTHIPELPSSRSRDLVELIQTMIQPGRLSRPSTDEILECVPRAREAGTLVDKFLTDYIRDVMETDRVYEQSLVSSRWDGQKRRFTPTGPNMSRNNADSDRTWNVRTPTPDQSGVGLLRAGPI